MLIIVNTAAWIVGCAVTVESVPIWTLINGMITRYRKNRGPRVMQEDDTRMSMVADITFGMTFGIIRKKSLVSTPGEGRV